MTESGRSKIDWDAVRKRLAQSESALSRTETLGEEQLAELYNRRAGLLAKRHLGDAAPSATFAVLVFLVCQESYAIELTELSEILGYSRCTPVPGGFPALLGLINVRGEIYPLLDLARLMELEPDGASGGGYVLMVRSHGTVVGLKVDQIEHVRDLRRDEVAFTEERSGELAGRHVKGMTEDTLMLIDVGGLVHKCVPAER